MCVNAILLTRLKVQHTLLLLILYGSVRNISSQHPIFQVLFLSKKHEKIL